MPQFQEVNQKIYSNGAKHVYGMDEQGKEHHISQDAVLESYGYSAAEAKQAAKEHGAPESIQPKSEIESQYDRIHKLRDEADAIKQERKAHAKWQMKVDTTDKKPSEQGLTPDDVAYNMWLEENATNEGTTSRSLRDKAEDLQAQENKERLRAAANLGMRVKTGVASGEEAAYYYSLKEAEDSQAPESAEATPDSDISAVEQQEELSYVQLATEITFAKITNNKEAKAALLDRYDKAFWSHVDSEGLSTREQNVLISQMLQDQVTQEANILGRLDDFEMTDEQRSFAEAYKITYAGLLDVRTGMQLHSMATKFVAGEGISGDINAALQLSIDRYALLNGLDETEKKAYADELAQRLDDMVNAPAEVGQEDGKHINKTTEIKEIDPDNKPKHLRGAENDDQAKKGVFGRMKDWFNNGSKEQVRGKITLSAIGAIGAGILGLAMLSSGSGTENVNDTAETTSVAVEDSSPDANTSAEAGGENDSTSDVDGSTEDAEGSVDAAPSDTFDIEDGNGYTHEIEDAFPGFSAAQYKAEHEAALAEFGVDYLQGVEKYSEAGEQRLASSGTGNWAPGVREFFEARLVK